MLDTARAVRLACTDGVTLTLHGSPSTTGKKSKEASKADKGAATDGGIPSEVEAAATQRSASRIAKLRGQLRKAWSAGWRTARLIYRQIQTNEASVHGLHARSVCRNAQGSEAGHMARVDAAKRRVPSGRAATAGRDLQSCSPHDAYMLSRCRTSQGLRS